ncbi:hypothetical protein ABW19_dt0209487 [Dactylella cylindrospora]|nr:hypothetical protein ABW19_dt0209487 [Dactylella cylindrospora]
MCGYIACSLLPSGDRDQHLLAGSSDRIASEHFEQYKLVIGFKPNVDEIKALQGLNDILSDAVKLGSILRLYPWKMIVKYPSGFNCGCSDLRSARERNGNTFGRQLGKTDGPQIEKVARYKPASGILRIAKRPLLLGLMDEGKKFLRYPSVLVRADLLTVPGDDWSDDEDDEDGNDGETNIKLELPGAQEYHTCEAAKNLVGDQDHDQEGYRDRYRDEDLAFGDDARPLDFVQTSGHNRNGREHDGIAFRDPSTSGPPRLECRKKALEPMVALDSSLLIGGYHSLI